MNCEQKYNEARERAMKLSIDGYLDAVAIDEIFPELAESKDERIRKELIEHIKANYEADYVLFKKFSPDDVIAWLEKQGEQPTDKIEPKFKVGDWVILNGIIAKILDKQKYGFVGLDIDGKDFFCNYGHTDSMRLWSINDAKDGDVLLEEEIGEPFIYNGNRAIHFLGVHCGIYNGEFNPYGGIHHCGKNSHPATKEQRDFLFQKMKDAGYEWDDEKKELKKIEDKTLDADKVIEWIDEHVPTKFEDMENYVKDFKQDFGLC